MNASKYQVWGTDEAGTITHLTTQVEPVSDAAQAIAIEQNWKAWREQYLLDNPGDYPLRHSSAKTVKLHCRNFHDFSGMQSFDVSAA